MAYEIKDNTFTLFVNDKGGNDKRPDYTGKGKIDGKDVRVSVWKRTSANGTEYLSGAISEATPKAAEPAHEEPAKEALDDSIPF